MADDKTKKKTPAKRKPRPRPVHAVEITVWNTTGEALPDEIVGEFEAAVQAVQVEYFNKGIRLLTQTNKG